MKATKLPLEELMRPIKNTTELIGIKDRKYQDFHLFFETDTVVESPNLLPCTIMSSLAAER